MLTLVLLAIVAGVILTEVRFGTLRRRLFEMSLRLEALEGRTRELQKEIQTLRGAAGPAAALPGPAPSPTPVVPTPAPPAPTSVPAAPVLRSGAGGGAVPPIAPPTGPGAPVPPSTGASLEERLGTRWAVWVGGLALGLGGLLLVRYSIEQGFFGPGARVLMGLLFAALLIGAGEWFRRHGHKPALDALQVAHIPSILTAAGTVSLFGTLYAAHALYGFIGPAMAFVLLGAVGIATMLAAALHGPALAGLGLAGAYVAPMLVSSARPSPWPVVIYLAVVAAAAMGLARLRQWLWLALLVVGGAVVWGLIYLKPMGLGSPLGHLEWTLAGYLHTLVQLVLAATLIAVLPNRAVPDADARPDPVAAAALAPLAVLAMLMLGAGRYDLASAVPFTLAVAGVLLATAWLAPRAAIAAPLAGLVTLASLAVWPGLRSATDTSHLLREVAGVLLVPENVQSYLLFAAVAALAVAAPAALRLMRGRTLPVATAGLYALGAAVTPLLALVLVYLRVTQFDRSISFAFAAGVLALALALLAERCLRAEADELPATRLATGAFAAAAIAALAFALVACLERGYLTVALALAALGTAYVAAQKEIPLLRHAVTVLAAVVLARLAWNPRVMGDGVGTLPVLNWLLVGYGVPATAFFAGARLLERRGPDPASRLADAAAVLLAGLLCFFEVRHLLNNGDVLAQSSSHIEMGLLALIAFGLSYALMRLDLGRANPVFHIASMVLGGLAGLGVLVGLGLTENPLFTRDLVEGPTIFSSLLLAYLLPGLAAVLLARAARPHRPLWYVTAIAVLALLLIFGYVTLEVRHAFQGPSLWIGNPTPQAEVWAYSAAWLWLGLVLLAYGIFRGNLEARLASAALVLLSVAKVFLLDLAGLSGLWRALSFIVLGVVLIGIGLAYQHLVFSSPSPAAPPPPPAPAPGTEA